MTVIQIRTPNQGIVKVRIAGDTPTSEEEASIKNEFFLQERKQPVVEDTFENILKAAEKKGKDENFDYTTGADGGLRAKMSFGETPGDREAILSKEVGETGYTKDSLGRLALTPEGQKLRGMTPSDKNIIIEEEGFSFRDIADFAGIAPEAILGTVGAVAGGTLGSLVMPVGGTIAGSAIGGGAGSALGQGIEEIFENILGVQTQTKNEVLKDVAFEGVLGFGAGLLGDLVFAAGRTGYRGLSSLKRPTKELSNDALIRAERLVAEDALPSLERIGAPRLMAYTQKFGENITRDETRIMANIDFALKKKQEYLDMWGKSIEETGQLALDVGSKKFDKLGNAARNAQQATLKAIDDSIELLEKSLKKGTDLNDVTLTKIVESFANFNQTSKANFKSIDAALNQMGEVTMKVGDDFITKPAGNANILSLRNVRSAIDDLTDGATIGESLKQTTRQYMRQLQKLDKTQNSAASFSQLSRIRKSINDTLFDPTEALGPVSTKELMKLRNALDDTLSKSKIEDFILTENLTKQQIAQLKKVAKVRSDAVSHYKKGMDKYDILRGHGIIKDIRTTMRQGGRFDVDKFYHQIIDVESPQRLKDVLGLFSKEEAEQLRSQLARRYLDDALFDKAKRSIDDPNKFSGERFYQELLALKTTGKVLFGNNYDEIMKLGKALAQGGVKSVDNEVLERTIGSMGSAITREAEELLKAVDAGGVPSSMTSNLKKILQANKIEITGQTTPEEGIAALRKLRKAGLSEESLYVQSLKRFNDANIDLNEATSVTLLKNIREGKIEAEQVVDALARPGVTLREIRAVKKFYKDTDVFEQIQGSVVQRILGDVDPNIFQSQAAADRLKNVLNNFDKKGTLEELVGKQQADAMKQFADDISFLGDVGKEGSVAAAKYTANPIKNMGELARNKVMTYLFSNKQILQKYINARKKVSSTQGIAQVVSDTMNEAGLELTTSNNFLRQGLVQGMRGLSQVRRQTIPRAIIEGVNMQNKVNPNQSRTTPMELPTLPIANNRDLFNISFTGQTPAKTTLSPIEMVRQNAFKKMSLRDRAAKDPYLAASLLGGLGSAGLLKN